jgi:NADPH-dependent 7-cyano-7-deazaguanine reductase QueF
MAHLCPIKDELDEGYVTVSWTCSGRTLELHSLAQWLGSFTGVRITHEDLVGHIATTLTDAADGGVVSIEVSFAGRTAGMHVTAHAVLR